MHTAVIACGVAVLFLAACARVEYTIQPFGEDSEMKLPYGSAIDAARDRYYVTDCPGNAVYVFSLNGQLLDRWEGFNHPTGLALDRKGNLYIADYAAHRIQKRTPDGRLLLMIGEPGQEPGQFKLPYDVAVSDIGEIIVADYGNDRIQVFGPDGTFRRLWGRRGPGPGLFYGPIAIAVHSDLVYVSDNENNRIQVFTADGAFRLTWGHQRLHRPFDLAIGAGHVYVTDTEHDQVQIFTLRGDWLRSIDGLHKPKTVAVFGDTLYAGNLVPPLLVRIRIP